MTTQHHINTAMGTANSERARRVAIRYLVRNEAHDPAAHAALNSITDPLGLSLRREARNRHWAAEMEIRPGDMAQIADDDGETTIATIAKGLLIGICIGVLIWMCVDAARYYGATDEAVEVRW